MYASQIIHSNVKKLPSSSAATDAPESYVLVQRNDRLEKTYQARTAILEAAEKIKKTSKFVVKGLSDAGERHAFNSAIIAKHQSMEEVPVLHYRMLQAVARGTPVSANSLDVADLP